MTEHAPEHDDTHADAEEVDPAAEAAEAEQVRSAAHADAVDAGEAEQLTPEQVAEPAVTNVSLDVHDATHPAGSTGPGEE